MLPARRNKPLLNHRLWLPATAVAALAMFAVLASHNVSTMPTPDDRTSAQAILAKAGYDGRWRSGLDTSTFAGQVAAVLAVQDAVIKASPNAVQIPLDAPREPIDLLRRGMGECAERSRVIEKLLATLGLETRHAAIYSLAKTGSRVMSLLTPQVDSHAVTEVHTSKGWMVIDSTSRWIGLTRDNKTISLEALQSIDPAKTRWRGDIQGKPHPVLSTSYTYVAGLYSRHGRFYAPYTPIPDVNWNDLVVGLFS